VVCAGSEPRMEPTANEPVPAPDAETAAGEAEPQPGLGQRELTMIAAALIGSGAITLGLLSIGGTSTAAAPGPARTARPVVTSASPDPAASASVAWTENSRVWTGGARKSVAFELPSRNETQVWMKTVRPLLVVRCINGRTDAFVFTDSPAAMEQQDEDHTVRLAFDGEEPRMERWPDSTEHDALFAPNGRALAARLEQARTFKFGYTPHNSSPVVARFDVGGLGHKLSAARTACGK
jgi:hypothetical protein